MFRKGCWKGDRDGGQGLVGLKTSQGSLVAPQKERLDSFLPASSHTNLSPSWALAFTASTCGNLLMDSFFVQWDESHYLPPDPKLPRWC